MDGVTWPDRGGGSSPGLPPSVVTGRIVFQSDSGEACCVAVDPSLLSPTEPGQALLILDDLPPGRATVVVSGFSTDFAPAPPDIPVTCKTVPPTAAMPCDPVRIASPAFESAPLVVNIVAGAQTNLGEVDIVSLPFLAAFSPVQNEVVTPPFRFDFTVVDAVTGIRAESVAVEVTFQVAEGEPPVFRPITKRVPIDLSACADGTEAPCSTEGDFDLVGFKAGGNAPALPVGPVEARIMAANLANPPRTLDFRYPFVVAATPEPTPTATPPGAGAAGGKTSRDRPARAAPDADTAPQGPTATPTATPVLP
jgi:hypothetical protein